VKIATRKFLAGLCAALLVGSVAMADTPNNLDRIIKDMRVMSKVLESATGEGSRKTRIHVTGEYLARQGIVLRIKFSGSRHGDFDFDSDFSLQYAPEVSVSIAPVPPGTPPLLESPEVDPEDIQDLVDQAMEEAEYSVDFASAVSSDNDHRSARNALREQRRQLAKESRELAEKTREVRREARKLSEEKRAEYLKKHNQELDTLRRENRQKAEALRAASRQQRKQSIERRNQYANAQIAAVMESFCEYVRVPRSLPKNEFVTLQIRNAVISERGKQDRYFVLTHKQMSACSNGGLTGAELAKQALSYAL